MCHERLAHLYPNLKLYSGVHMHTCIIYANTREARSSSFFLPLPSLLQYCLALLRTQRRCLYAQRPTHRDLLSVLMQRYHLGRIQAGPRRWGKRGRDGSKSSREISRHMNPKTLSIRTQTLFAQTHLNSSMIYLFVQRTSQSPKRVFSVLPRCVMSGLLHPLLQAYP